MPRGLLRSSRVSTDEILGLIDCSDFYVSYESVFGPDLEGKPVVVRSSNDGCFVALSQVLWSLLDRRFCWIFEPGIGGRDCLSPAIVTAPVHSASGITR